MNCKQCKYFDRNDMPKSDGIGICRFKPPSAVMVGVPNAISGKPETQTIAVWPPVRDGEFCSNYTAKLEKVNDSVKIGSTNVKGRISS